MGTASAYLAIGATTVNIGLPSGTTQQSGSARIKLNLGSVQSTVNVFNTGTGSTDSALEPCRIKGTHASNALNVVRGQVGVATTDSSEVATFATVSVNGDAAKLNLGAGCTLTTVNQGGGQIVNYGANCPTLAQTDGTYTVYKTATHTTATIGGTFNHVSTGTITTANVYGVLDSSGDPRAKTITTLKLFRGGRVTLRTGKPNSVVITNGVQLQSCSLADVSLDVGDSITLSLS